MCRNLILRNSEFVILINNEYLRNVECSLDSFRLQDENITFEPASTSQDLLNRISVVIKNALLFYYTLWLNLSGSWYSKSENLKRLTNITRLVKDEVYSDIASMFSSRLLASGNSSNGSYIALNAAFIARSMSDLFDKHALSNAKNVCPVNSSSVELVKIIRDTTHQLSETDDFYNDSVAACVDQRFQALLSDQIRYFSFDVESHQMVLSIKKMQTGKYSLNIFNTGKGINYHHKRKMGIQNCVYRIQLTVAKVGHAKCRQFLQKLYTDTGPALSIKELYTQVLPKIGKVVKKGPVSEYDREQIGNDCTVRVLFGCLKDQVRKRRSKDLYLEYKAFKLRLRIDFLLEFVRNLMANGSTRKDLFSLHEIAVKILSHKNRKILSNKLIDQVHVVKSKCESALFLRKGTDHDPSETFTETDPLPLSPVARLADSLTCGDFIHFRSAISKTKELVNDEKLAIEKKIDLLRPILDLDMRDVMGFRSVEMILGLADLFQSAFSAKMSLPKQIKNYMTCLNGIIIDAKIIKTIG